jgi:alpha-galactosidase/6-phospho-beta-glucosidase family protein
MGNKVTIIGGGSSIFVPALIRGLIRSPIMDGGRVTLMDVNESRLRVMEALAKRLIDSEGVDLAVERTLDQRASLVDANYVIVAISVGGIAAWENDIEIPGRYGVFSQYADSTGPGGIMRAFRNVPVLVSVARDLAEVGARDAWILNYTNPAPVQTLAMNTVPGVNHVSLCSGTGLPSDPQWLAEQVGVSPEEIAMAPIVGGINHCTAVVDLRLTDGRDALPLIRERATNPVVRWAIDTYGVLPYCWSHWVEFHAQMQDLTEPYEGVAQGLEMRYGLRIYDMADQHALASKWGTLAKEWTAPDAPPVSLSDLPLGQQDDGIQVIDVIEAIALNRNEVYIVNTTNGGAISNLPADAVVEVPALVNRSGIHPLRVGPLPEAYAAHLTPYCNAQRLMVRAALSGDREEALHAFLLDPLVQKTLTVDDTAALLDELLEVNASMLPQFERSVAAVRGA